MLLSWSTTFLAACVLGLWISWFSSKKQKRNDDPKLKSIPVVPGALFLIGNKTEGGIQNLVACLTGWLVQHGNVSSNASGFLQANLFGQSFYLVCNNERALAVMKLRPNIIRRAAVEIEAIQSVGADGVFSAQGKIWGQDRRIMAPPLNRKNMTDYFPFIQKITKRLVEKWNDESINGSSVPINQDLMKLMIDYIGMIAFDQDYDCLRNPHAQQAKDLKRMFKCMQLRALSPIQYWKIPILGKYLDGATFNVGRLMNEIQAIITSYSSNSNNQSPSKNSNNNRSKTYLQKLLDQHDSMSQQRVMGNLLTMFAAGSETTANVTMVCFWELLQEENRPYLEEVLVELQQLEKDCGALESNALTAKTFLQSVPKLRALFYEVVRFRGTAPALFLCVGAQEGVEIGGYHFPCGTEFFMPLEYLGKLDDPLNGIPQGPNGEPPGVFCPRRWLRLADEKGEDDTGTSKTKDNNNQQQVWTVIKPSSKCGVNMSSGFGSGVRICPGQDLAELEATYCLASIFQHFDVSLMPDHPPMKLISSFTQTPNVDIRLVLKSRRRGGE